MYDITSANRAEVEDAKDPGGRIGPYVGDGDPDLRNLEIVYTVCHPGDVVLVVSDGVHDNLDPISLGKAPKDLGLEGETHADWKFVDKSAYYAGYRGTSVVSLTTASLHVCSQEKSSKRKIHDRHSFATHKRMSLSNPSTDYKEDHPICKVLSFVNLFDLRRQIYGFYSLYRQVTESSRAFMEQNPHLGMANLPYTEYPGKMDHTTCIAFKVGDWDPNVVFVFLLC